jgi:hypothetical protein
MAPLTSVGRLLQVTEVIQTAASFVVFFLKADASTRAAEDFAN